MKVRIYQTTVSGKEVKSEKEVKPYPNEVGPTAVAVGPLIGGGGKDAWSGSGREKLFAGVRSDYRGNAWPAARPIRSSGFAVPRSSPTSQGDVIDPPEPIVS